MVFYKFRENLVGYIGLMRLLSDCVKYFTANSSVLRLLFSCFGLDTKSHEIRVLRFMLIGF